MFSIAACLERNNLEYWSWYDDISIIKIYFFLVSIEDSIGFPILPTVFTGYWDFYSASPFESEDALFCFRVGFNFNQ